MLVIRKNKRRKFNIIRSEMELASLIDRLPWSDEIFTFASKGGFSSISFVRFVADRAKIGQLTATTLRVGKKELATIDHLHKHGKIDKCTFVVGSIMKKDSEIGKSYKYYDNLNLVCKNNDWDLIVANNHSKILLFDTDLGKYVLETSSNLNENPKYEQFSFCRDTDLYQFYYDFIWKEMAGGDASG